MFREQFIQNRGSRLTAVAAAVEDLNADSRSNFISLQIDPKLVLEPDKKNE